MLSHTQTAATNTKTPRINLHLAVQRLSSGEPSEVVVRSAPCGEPNPTDFGALVILSMLSLHAYNTVNTKPPLHWDCGAFRNTGLIYDVWISALSWLLDGNAFRLFLPMIAPERFPQSAEERLEQLMIPVRRAESRACIPTNFFAQHYQKQFEITCLLDAALNADHTVLEKILDGKDDITIQSMLSISGTAIITHLGIERTGTPLQMAFYSHDEKAFKILAARMDRKIISDQLQKIFDDYGVRDYSELIKKQSVEANTLCSELAVAFGSNIDNPNAPPPFSAPPIKLSNVSHWFMESLNRYVSANPLHNPYILQRLFDIYDSCPRHNCDGFLASEQVIGLTQKLSSARWLQHFVEGIFYLAQQCIPELALSSFLFRHSSTVLDIRSQSVISYLGVNCSIDDYGVLQKSVIFRRSFNGWPGSRTGVNYQKFCQAKTESILSAMSTFASDARQAF